MIFDLNDLETLTQLANRLAAAKMRHSGMYAGEFQELSGEDKIGWQEWWSSDVGDAVAWLQRLRFAGLSIVSDEALSDLPDVDSLP